MLFSKANAPYLSETGNVQSLMLKVVYALIPGSIAMFWFFGWGVLFNLVIAISVCLISEAVMLKIRSRPLEPALKDGSALVTACLLALALPPLAPWWLTTVASLFAIVVAKHLYGGLGFNPFNPAMVGYVVVMISFPREMTFWTPPMGVAQGWPEFADAFSFVFLGSLPEGISIDSITMATPIDTLKTQINLEHDIAFTRAHRVYGELFGTVTGVGWEWINGLYLAGGLWLIKQGVIDKRLPLSFLISLILISNLFAVIDYASFSSALFHTLSGGTMLAAFFIITDPVTASTTPRGRIIYGAGIAAIAYIIRTWGGYPDGIAFAVLLMNMTVPLLDHYTRPRTYGAQDTNP
ncbi:MAG: electron transport complex subunit RsxD [Thiotrichales bacterium]|nr:MAG: electron transport complex subunit RsxD [Thiotrichales bacterium]